MATREEILREKTYKEDGIEIDRRVFNTLHDWEEAHIALQPHRNSKAISLLIKILCQKGILTDSNIDDILLEVIN